VFHSKVQKNILVITDHINEYKYFVEVLNKTKIFDQILIVEDRKLSERFNSKRTNFIFFQKKIKQFFDKETRLGQVLNDAGKINSIYIFLDETRTSQYLMFTDHNVVLVEDGSGLYSIEKLNLKRIVKGFLGIPRTRGKDKRVNVIEATKPDKLISSIRHKAILLNIADLQKNINKEQKDILMNIFFSSKFSSNKINDEKKRKVLLLTQPFSEDNCINEELKIKIYNSIIEQYINDYSVYIKPHPREITDYKKVISHNIIEIQRNFPIELFNIIPNLVFDKIISINSSAVNNLYCAYEKIQLGIDYNKELSVGYYNSFRIKKSNKLLI
jgi:hypothetical protein